jgi:hypothetical protein
MNELIDQLEKESTSGAIHAWSSPQLAASLSAAISLMESWSCIHGLRLDSRACVQARTAKTSASVNRPAS